MSLTYEDMRPCRACGAPCDGDVCDASCALWLMDTEPQDDEDNEDEEDDE